MSLCKLICVELEVHFRYFILRYDPVTIWAWPSYNMTRLRYNPGYDMTRLRYNPVTIWPCYDITRLRYDPVTIYTGSFNRYRVILQVCIPSLDMDLLFCGQSSEFEKGPFHYCSTTVLSNIACLYKLSSISYTGSPRLLGKLNLSFCLLKLQYMSICYLRTSSYQGKSGRFVN